MFQICAQFLPKLLRLIISTRISSNPIQLTLFSTTPWLFRFQLVVRNTVGRWHWRGVNTVCSNFHLVALISRLDCASGMVQFALWVFIVLFCYRLAGSLCICSLEFWLMLRFEVVFGFFSWLTGHRSVICNLLALVLLLVLLVLGSYCRTAAIHETPKALILAVVCGGYCLNESAPFNVRCCCFCYRWSKLVSHAQFPDVWPSFHVILSTQVLHAVQFSCHVKWWCGYVAYPFTWIYSYISSSYLVLLYLVILLVCKHLCIFYWLDGLATLKSYHGCCLQHKLKSLYIPVTIVLYCVACIM